MIYHLDTGNSWKKIENEYSVLKNEDGEFDFADHHGHGSTMLYFMAKIAPEEDIRSIKIVSSTETVELPNVIECLEYLVGKVKDGDIVSTNFGFLEESMSVEEVSSLKKAVFDILKTGAKVVASAGNLGQPISNWLPGAWTHKNLYIVGSLNKSGGVARFNNVGDGINAWVTSTNQDFLGDKKSGTSVAAAYFSGVLHMKLKKKSKILKETLKREMITVRSNIFTYEADKILF